jgi:hypothetical protein
MKVKCGLVVTYTLKKHLTALTRNNLKTPERNRPPPPGIMEQTPAKNPGTNILNYYIPITMKSVYLAKTLQVLSITM